MWVLHNEQNCFILSSLCSCAIWNNTKYFFLIWHKNNVVKCLKNYWFSIERENPICCINILQPTSYRLANVFFFFYMSIDKKVSIRPALSDISSNEAFFNRWVYMLSSAIFQVIENLTRHEISKIRQISNYCNWFVSLYA